MRRLLSRFLEWLPATAYRLDRKSLRNPLATDLGCSAILIACLAIFVLGLGAVIAHCDPPPDPLAVKGISQVWLGAQSTWSSSVDRKDVAVAQVNALLPMGRWGLGLRARSTGAVGQFRPDVPTTFGAVEAYVEVHRVVFERDGVQLSPTGFAGIAIPLESQNGKPPVMPRTCTAMGGLRIDGLSWRGEVGFGVHQQLEGLALGVTAHVEMTPHSAWVLDFAAGARRNSVTPYVAAISLLLRP